MDVVFPVSGVETHLWLPPLVALVVSYFTSMAGVSGAFLLLPFQMSVLGFDSPAVSPTNLVFNIVAIPSGVVRYVREGRMIWPLTWTVVAGTLPGVVIGGFLRLRYLPDPGAFKAFAGCVLLYIGGRLLWDLWRGRGISQPCAGAPPSAGAFQVKIVAVSVRELAYEFQGARHSCKPLGVLVVSLVVGVVGGVYGIGGGAIMAPFLVAIYRLPIHTITGATLMGTFVTSIVGVAFYEAVAPWYGSPDRAVSPDWLLGALFGLGGLVGMYLGARTQRFVPAQWLKLGLGAIMLYVAIGYIVGFFWR